MRIGEVAVDTMTATLFISGGGIVTVRSGEVAAETITAAFTLAHVGEVQVEVEVLVAALWKSRKGEVAIVALDGGARRGGVVGGDAVVVVTAGVLVIRVLVLVLVLTAVWAYEMLRRWSWATSAAAACTSRLGSESKASHNDFRTPA